MALPRTMLTRVRRLERGQVSPILVRLGGEEGWADLQADVAEGLANGRYDRHDIPTVLDCMRKWMSL